MKKIKISLIFLALLFVGVLAFQISFGWKSSDEKSSGITQLNKPYKELAKYPDFTLNDTEDDFVDAAIMYEVASLAPTVPAEAQFDEMNYEMVSALNLVPVTPAVADFQDADSFDFRSLSPVVPAVANFE